MRFGQDANWDLKNYHFYDAYAFLHGRLQWDVAAAQFQSYFNPLVDLPFYFLVQAQSPPRLIAALMATTTGVAAFFLLRLLVTLFPRRMPDHLLWIVLAFAVGASGSMGASTLGTTMNEWPCTMLLMASLSLLVSSIAAGGSPSRRALAASGLLTGFAVGLKLTYGVFGLALAAAMASFGSARERVRRILAMGTFLFAGFVLSYGFWGAILYREFANPFFPFFNAIFKSPWWEPVSWFDRFGPRNLLQAVAFPLYFARESLLVSEVAFRDWRMAVLYVAAFLCAVRYLYLRHHAPRPAGDPALRNAWLLLGSFTLVAYLVWLKMFGMYRYLVLLEMLSGPLMVGALLYLVPGRMARRAVVLVVVAFILGTTRKTSWGRIEFGDSYFDVGVPAVAPNALVIMGPHDPMAYIVPFFPADARFVSPDNNLLRPGQKNLLARRIGSIIDAHRGPIYSLGFAGRANLDEGLRHYGLERDARACSPIRSPLDGSAMRLCPVSRAPGQNQ